MCHILFHLESLPVTVALYKSEKPTYSKVILKRLAKVLYPQKVRNNFACPGLFQDKFLFLGPPASGISRDMIPCHHQVLNQNFYWKQEDTLVKV